MFSIYKKLYQWFAILSILFVGFFCSYENDSNTETANPIEKKITPQKEYTFENPGQWEAIRSEHIPEIRFDKNQKKDNLKVQLNGKNFSERHYIEAIGIMDLTMKDIDLKYMKRGDIPTAILSLNSKEHEPSSIKVFVKCNLHDLWTIPLVKKIE